MVTPGRRDARLIDFTAQRGDACAGRDRQPTRCARLRARAAGSGGPPAVEIPKTGSISCLRRRNASRASAVCIQRCAVSASACSETSIRRPCVLVVQRPKAGPPGSPPRGPRRPARSPAPMLEALEAQQPTLGTLVAVGAGVVGEAAVVEGVRGRTARFGDRHGRRARGAGGQVGGREVAGVGQGQSRSGAAGLLGGLDHREQLGLVGWVLGDVRGGDQQPTAAAPGPVRAASFVALAALGFALAASVFALLVANVLAFAASVFALLVADVLAAAGVPVVPLTRSLEPQAPAS